MNKFIQISFVLYAFFLLLVSTSIYSKGEVTYSLLGAMNSLAQKESLDQFVEMSFKQFQKEKRYNFIYIAQLRHYVNNESTIFSVPEAYIHKDEGIYEWSVGRKIIDWQKNDKFWALGEVNPLRGFNLIDTEREGITGFHFQIKKKKWKINIQASPVHIPQVNPTFSANDGSIVGKNEWAYPPAKFVKYRDNLVPIHYTLEYPDIKDLLLKNSASASFSFKHDRNSWTIYGGYKPETGIRINATGLYEQFDEARAIVKAKPFVNHHVFWGGSFQHLFKPFEASEQWFFSSGIEGVIPEIGTDLSFEFEALKIEPRYERLTYSTLSLTYKNLITQISLNTLYLIDGDVIDNNVFAKKPKWRRALGVSLDYWPLKELKFNALYRYDIKTKDMTLVAEVNYRFSKHIFITGGIQLVNAPSDYFFWSAYRSNDRLYSKMSYLF